jgi:hypothetical protein
MFIAELKDSTNGVRRSGIQLDLQLASIFPLIPTPPEGSCSSSYKYATPNGVNRKRFFSPTSAVDGFFRTQQVRPSRKVHETELAFQCTRPLSCEGWI